MKTVASENDRCWWMFHGVVSLYHIFVRHNENFACICTFSAKTVCIHVSYGCVQGLHAFKFMCVQLCIPFDKSYLYSMRIWWMLAYVVWVLLNGYTRSLSEFWRLKYYYLFFLKKCSAQRWLNAWEQSLLYTCKVAFLLDRGSENSCALPLTHTNMNYIIIITCVNLITLKFSSPLAYGVYVQTYS